MGISGLIPFLEKASKPINIKKIKGNTVAIDSYCFLHKGAFSCADKLARGEKVFTHIQYCLKYVNMLLQHDIKPILVFDGRHLPAKSLTEEKRRESRQIAKKRAADLLRLGKIEEARSFLRRCVDITHEMALQLIQECRKINVDCIVAPYEADAQLAFLNINDIAQYVITEDSDLVLFGCKKIIFKLDLSGNGLLVESNKLHLTMGCIEEKFVFEKFRHMCILSGCDYLDSLPGIGLAKSCKFMLKTSETDIPVFLRKLPAYLNMRHLEITDDYINNFLKADATFQHMLIYNPILRKLMPLNDPSKTGINEEFLCNAGEMLDNKIAFQLALGNLDPFTLKQLDVWDPDILPPKLKFNKHEMRHKSIWKSEFQTHKSPILTELKGELKIKPFSYKNMVDEETVERISDGDLLASYCIETREPAQKRLCTKVYESEDETIISPNKMKRNPFLKTKSLSSHQNKSPANSPSKMSLLNHISPIKRTNLLKKFSKFDRTVLKPDEKVVSKFFNDPIKIENSSLDKDKSNRNRENKIEIVEECFDIENSNSDEDNLILSNSTKENEIMFQSLELTSATSSSCESIKNLPSQIGNSNKKSIDNSEKPKQKSNCRRQGLSRKNTTSGPIQTKLSQFGFQKRPQLN